MSSENVPAFSLLHLLTDICDAIVRADYGRAKELFSLTTKSVYPAEIASLAEAFGMMLVKLEAREFEKEEIAAGLEAASKELDRFRRLSVMEAGNKHSVGNRKPSRRNMVGNSEAMREVLRLIERFSQVKSTVLITGETGTGKGVIATLMHYSGERARGPFVAVNCAAIPGSLLESELFGIEKGVASGVTARIGRFEQANGGTIFLDEIGDMPLESQAKILHSIENGVVERVGGRQSIPIDVRIVAATHRDLAALSEKKLFRSDLFYRLNVLRLHVPPLRERLEDIPPLARHFLDSIADRNSMAARGIDKEAVRLLMGYQWPGNIRELEHEVERAALLACGPVITSQDLSPLIHEQASVAPAISTYDSPVLPHPLEKFTRHTVNGFLPGLYPRTLSEAELETVKAALAAAGGNKTKAAKTLGITREGFRKMLKRLGIP
ncbi:MAG: sigma-54 dependent transcriptional regulator [Deltaproteobacteria bacterium]|jgi:DNA-binding NtrC family response regulator|nr:sigma-54 dependent transcriptional regulator [Deltaproteobacteria bacterium]